VTAASERRLPVDLAWQAYTAEERRARTNYLAAVQAAQADFDIAIRPAYDGYRASERNAWTEYIAVARAAKRRYLEAVPHETAGPPADSDVSRETSGLAAGPLPVPTFTAAPESHPYPESE